MRLRDRRPFIWASRGFAPSSVNMKAASVVGGARGGYGNDRVTGEVTSGSGGSSSSGFAVVAKQSMRALIASQARSITRLPAVCSPTPSPRKVSSVESKVHPSSFTVSL